MIGLKRGFQKRAVFGCLSCIGEVDISVFFWRKRVEYTQYM